MAVDIYSSEALPETAPARCPVNHEVFARRKTVRAAEGPGPAVERDASGTWHVRDYALARAILRGDSARQAGFKAELVAQVSTIKNQPILFLEGQPHHQQRRQTARFFTPRAVGSNYRALMERLSDELVGTLRKRGRADLSELSMTLAVQVAAEVVGLTNSRLPGMDRRLDAFFASAPVKSSRLRMIFDAVRNQAVMFTFFLLDVKPAIRARRATPREDVISHLIGQGYSEPEILTECVTYGAAGMATTREFICAAAWHMLEQPALRQRYLAAGEDERYAILHEILRQKIQNLSLAGHTATHNFQVLSAGNLTGRGQTLSRVDIAYAEMLGYTIKLLGIVKALGTGSRNRVQVSVYPALVPERHVLASVDDVFNAVFLRGDVVGDTLWVLEAKIDRMSDADENGPFWIIPVATK